ncbi:sniffer isoform 1 [Acyrthosiphon pisum]|uniref:ACYPI004813 protein n=2 Tax=Acyrthosiphon pisum TaxID=7029 RepID=C4WY93_ACYPI|nr:sniffer isoform 1 [Acyrthosiphon pisum]BAH72863.1 ACYPI004813 [Acyrthosiphon pisum]|eukprot:NP_001155929.1 sniffer isoform 1 [Acyrthosiphon pisum]
MCSVLVTGANRGIGLGLVKHLLSNQAFNVENVFATCRDMGKAKELMELKKNPQLHILEADLIDHGSFFNLASQVSNIVKDKGLNVLINNAGISSKFTRIGLVKSEDLLNHFKINTIGPIMLTQALLPLLKMASEKDKSATGVYKAVIVNMSSILGSITKNDQGGFYPYRTSKTAINVATKSLSVDLKNNGILAVSIHPGWVKTAMGGTSAPLEVEQSVTGICHFLKNINKSHNGGFYDFEGKVLPW